MNEWTHAIAGGALIGLASGLLMLWLGRIAGVSGALHGALDHQPAAPGERAWRVAFVLGLLAAGATLALLFPAATVPAEASTTLPRAGWLIAAGLLVGFGTRLGSGCTSGHGVCGLARLSLRSLAAVATFLATGIAATYLLRHVWQLASS